MSNRASGDQSTQIEFDKIKVNCFTILIIEGIQAFFFDLYTTFPGYDQSFKEECQKLWDWSFATFCTLGISVLFCGLNILGAYQQKAPLVKFFSMMVGFSQLAILITYCGDWIYLNSNCGSLNHLNKVIFIIMVGIISISTLVQLFKWLSNKFR